jgi:hypothetical protein
MTAARSAGQRGKEAAGRHSAGGRGFED